LEIERAIRQYHAAIYKYCYHMLRHAQEAEDAAQEVFLRAWKAAGRSDDIQAIRPWLYKVAHNHCVNVIRRRRLLRFLPYRAVDGRLDAARAAETEWSEAIEVALDALSPTDRSILLLRVLEERPYEEIGSMIDMRSESVRKRFERARKKLQASFSREKEGTAGESESISYV